jgi:hypothetical protein
MTGGVYAGGVTAPLPDAIYEPGPQALFWSHVDKAGDCWLWTGWREAQGYGKWEVAGRKVRAHRVSLAIATGHEPEGALALHGCGVRACVRPDHLRWGDQEENAADRHRHGTFHRKPRTGQQRSGLTRVVPFRLPHDVCADLEQRAGEEGRSVSAVLRGLVEAYLDSW